MEEMVFIKVKLHQNIVKCMERTDGIITLDDLENYEAIERNPIEFEYKNYKVCNATTIF